MFLWFVWLTRKRWRKCMQQLSQLHWHDARACANILTLCLIEALVLAAAILFFFVQFQSLVWSDKSKWLCICLSACLKNEQLECQASNSETRKFQTTTTWTPSNDAISPAKWSDSKWISMYRKRSHRALSKRNSRRQRMSRKWVVQQQNMTSNVLWYACLHCNSQFV